VTNLFKKFVFACVIPEGNYRKGTLKRSGHYFLS